MKIYMVVGCPGSGKSWVCEQLEDFFEYVHHDLYIGMAGTRYVEAILEVCETAEKPVLTEAPFSISQLKKPLETAGHEVQCVFIMEDPEVIADRYLNREGKAIPKGHLTRQETYRERASEYDSFIGTSEEVLEFLKRECTSHTT